MKKLFDCHCDTLTKVMECEQNLIESHCFHRGWRGYRGQYRQTL